MLRNVCSEAIDHAESDLLSKSIDQDTREPLCTVARGLCRGNPEIPGHTVLPVGACLVHRSALVCHEVHPAKSYPISHEQHLSNIKHSRTSSCRSNTGTVTDKRQQYEDFCASMEIAAFAEWRRYLWKGNTLFRSVAVDRLRAHPAQSLLDCKGLPSEEARNAMTNKEPAGGILTARTYSGGERSPAETAGNDDDEANNVWLQMRTNASSDDTTAAAVTIGYTASGTLQKPRTTTYVRPMWKSNPAACRLADYRMFHEWSLWESRPTERSPAERWTMVRDSGPRKSSWITHAASYNSAHPRDNPAEGMSIDVTRRSSRRGQQSCPHEEDSSAHEETEEYVRRCWQTNGSLSGLCMRRGSQNRVEQENEESLAAGMDSHWLTQSVPEVSTLRGRYIAEKIATELGAISVHGGRQHVCRRCERPSLELALFGTTQPYKRSQQKKTRLALDEDPSMLPVFWKEKERDEDESTEKKACVPVFTYTAVDSGTLPKINVAAQAASLPMIDIHGGLACCAMVDSEATTIAGRRFSMVTSSCSNSSYESCSERRLLIRGQSLLWAVQATWSENAVLPNLAGLLDMPLPGNAVLPHPVEAARRRKRKKSKADLYVSHRESDSQQLFEKAVAGEDWAPMLACNPWLGLKLTGSPSICIYGSTLGSEDGLQCKWIGLQEHLMPYLTVDSAHSVDEAVATSLQKQIKTMTGVSGEAQRMRSEGKPTILTDEEKMQSSAPERKTALEVAGENTSNGQGYARTFVTMCSLIQDNGTCWSLLGRQEPGRDPPRRDQEQSILVDRVLRQRWPVTTGHLLETSARTYDNPVDHKGRFGSSAANGYAADTTKRTRIESHVNLCREPAAPDRSRIDPVVASMRKEASRPLPARVRWDTTKMTTCRSERRL